jgi:uncharacterized membrane protein YfcA
VSPAALAAVGVAVAAGAAAQPVAGLGFSLVSVPFLVALLGASDGVRMCVLLSIGLNVVLLARDPGAVRWRPVAALLSAAAVTAVLVGLVASDLPELPTRLAAGLSICVGVVLLISGRRAPRLVGLGGALTAGAVAGAMNALASVAGPPVALWAGNRDWPARTTRAIMQAFFAPLNVVTIVALGLPTVGAAVLIVAVTGLAAGTGLGIAVAGRLAEPTARRATLTVAGLGGAALVVSAVVGLVT